MDRQVWLDEQRRTIENRYDHLYSPTYDEADGPIPPMHRRFVEQLIQSTPRGGRILDAPCGTGRYFPMVLDAGRSVVGIDQSAGMLAKAHEKHPDVVVQQRRLHELAFDGEFDAAMCVDATEYVFPEDWPVVLAKLRRAVRPGGLVYLTIEQVSPAEIATVYEEAKADGLPVVHGENIRRGGGYHHYPAPHRVSGWLMDAGLRVVDEGVSRASNYGYHHLLVSTGE
jgi:ubiquinone/menaquinone biosynthesis C-methylase UbiE